ncbi:hypothetical protein KKE14_01790 [Patescibacteria group bacterium]|nr:hypothetical protein [Patescibacteria group bacterium]
MQKFTSILILLFLLFGATAISAAEDKDPFGKPDKERLEELNKVIKEDYDKMENISWYLNANSSYLNGLELYTGDYKEKGFALLRFRAGTKGDGWIFFKKIIILADDERYVIDFDYLARETEVVGGSCYETVDVPIYMFVYDEEKLVKDLDVDIDKARLTEFKSIFDKQCVLTLDDAKKIASASEVIIRFSGDKYREFKIRDKQLQPLRDTMQYYLWILTDIGEKANAAK